MAEGRGGGGYTASNEGGVQNKQEHLKNKIYFYKLLAEVCSELVRGKCIIYPV